MCRITHVSYRAYTYTEIDISYTDRQSIAINVEDKTCILPHTGGACGVMVIVAGYGYGDTSSNPGRDWLHFT